MIPKSFSATSFGCQIKRIFRTKLKSQIKFFSFFSDVFDTLILKIKNYFNIFLNKKIFLKNILYHNIKLTLKQTNKKTNISLEDKANSVNQLKIIVGVEVIILLYCQKDSILFLFYFLKKGDKPSEVNLCLIDVLYKLSDNLYLILFW
jgi:hypothetical protein